MKVIITEKKQNSLKQKNRFLQKPTLFILNGWHGYWYELNLYQYNIIFYTWYIEIAWKSYPGCIQLLIIVCFFESLKISHISLYSVYRYNKFHTSTLKLCIYGQRFQMCWTKTNQTASWGNRLVSCPWWQASNALQWTGEGGFAICNKDKMFWRSWYGSQGTYVHRAYNRSPSPITVIIIIILTGIV